MFTCVFLQFSSMSSNFNVDLMSRYVLMGYLKLPMRMNADAHAVRTKWTLPLIGIAECFLLWCTLTPLKQEYQRYGLLLGYRAAGRAGNLGVRRDRTCPSIPVSRMPLGTCVNSRRAVSFFEGNPRWGRTGGVHTLLHNLTAPRSSDEKARWDGTPRRPVGRLHTPWTKVGAEAWAPVWGEPRWPPTASSLMPGHSPSCTWWPRAAAFTSLLGNILTVTVVTKRRRKFGHNYNNQNVSI